MATEITATRPPRFAGWAQVLKSCGHPAPETLDGVGRWLLISRACVQPMTLTAAAIAGLLAAPAPTFHFGYFALAALGIVLAHAANNMINDYFDLSQGQDTEAYPRGLYAPHPISSGLITARGLARAIVVVNVFDALIMILLFLARGWPVIAFAVAGLLISVFYVAPPLRFKAHGLGEPSVFMIWGPLMVGGTYYSATAHLPPEVIWASVPYALLVTTVLFGKHIDKAPWDAPEGVNTLPVLLGEERGRRATATLMIAFYIAVVALVLAGVLAIWSLVVLAGAGSLVRTLRTYRAEKPASPPPRYPLWPLWFGPWAFVHARRAGALLVIGLAAGDAFPTFINF